MQTAGDEQLRGDETPAPTEDEITWLHGGHQCHSETEKDPHVEEEIAQAIVGIECGEATLLAMDSGHDMRPSQGTKTPKAPRGPYRASQANCKLQRASSIDRPLRRHHGWPRTWTT
jgi:hypothetical protein